MWVWVDDFGLVQQGQRVGGFQYVLDYEYYVWMIGIIFIKQEGDWVLQGLWQDVFLEFGDLFVVFKDDGVFVDYVDMVDMVVQVNVYYWLVELGGYLFDMGGFIGVVIVLDYDVLIIGKVCQDGVCGCWVEDIVFVDFWCVFVVL